MTIDDDDDVDVDDEDDEDDEEEDGWRRWKVAAWAEAVVTFIFLFLCCFLPSSLRFYRINTSQLQVYY